MPAAIGFMPSTPVLAATSFGTTSLVKLRKCASMGFSGNWQDRSEVVRLRLLQHALVCFPGLLSAPATTEVMNWATLGAALLALAVAMGAFGAHGLRSRLDAHSMSVYEKAVFYHFIHALGILIVALLARTRAIPVPSLGLVGWLLFLGIILFSGSLYALAISGVRVLGAITPIGGLCFIAGWIVLAVEVIRVQRI